MINIVLKTAEMYTDLTVSATKDNKIKKTKRCKLLYNKCSPGNIKVDF
jgi:hypothetical protein